MCLDKISMLLDTSAPLKRINVYKLKFKSKSLITLGNLRLTKINICEKEITNFINKKDPILKEQFHTNYKKCRNLLSIFMKRSKQTKYFETNWNNIKNT